MAGAGWKVTLAALTLAFVLAVVLVVMLVLMALLVLVLMLLLVLVLLVVWVLAVLVIVLVVLAVVLVGGVGALALVVGFNLAVSAPAQADAIVRAPSSCVNCSLSKSGPATLADTGDGRSVVMTSK